MRRIWTKLLTESLNWKTLTQTLWGNAISVGFPLFSRTKRHRPPNRATMEHHDTLESLEKLRGIETKILAKMNNLAGAVQEAVGE